MKTEALSERAKSSPSGHRDVDATTVARMLGRVRLVDVREPHELVGELGHVTGVENVPLGDIETAARTWDKEQELVLVCRSGGRSARAAALLASKGFDNVMNMIGGMLAWNDARLPVAR